MGAEQAVCAADSLIAGIVLKDDKVAFEGLSATNKGMPVKFDYIPPIGTGNGFRGLELLLITVGGCFSTAVVYNLRKKGKNPKSYEMNLKGIKNDTILALSKIEGFIEIVSDDVTDEDLSEAIAASMEMSPVYLAIKGNVEMTVTGKVISRN